MFKLTEYSSKIKIAIYCVLVTLEAVRHCYTMSDVYFILWPFSV